MRSIDEAIKAYLAHCRYDKNLGGLTLKAYGQDLRQFTIWSGRKKAIGDLTKEHMRAYVQHLFSLGLLDTSVKRKVASLKAFLRFLEVEDHIPVSPFRKLDVRIRTRKRVPKYLSIEEVKGLFNAAKSDAAPSNRLQDINHSSGLGKADGFAIVQRLIVIELLFSTGVRVSELCALNISDLDLKKKAVTVAGKGSRDRTVVITNESTLRVLAKYITLRTQRASLTSALLLNRRGKRLQPDSIRSILRKLSNKASLTEITRPHMFRHTIATLLLENGVDLRFVQKFLGHSSIVTTQMYTHLSTKAERETLGARHPRNMI